MVNDRALERLYEHVVDGEDEQSLLTRHLIADVLLERAVTVRVAGLKIVEGETVDSDVFAAAGFEPVFFSERTE